VAGKRVAAPAPARCLPSSTRIDERGIGDVRLGMTPDQMRAGAVQPLSTRRGVFRYCVDGTRGWVDAVVDRDRVRLVTSTARTTLPPLQEFPRRRRVARGLFRAAPRSSRVIGVRKGRVSYAGVTERGLLRSVRVLRKLLHRAGL
jgi:hypothetical protein